MQFHKIALINNLHPSKEFISKYNKDYTVNPEIETNNRKTERK